MKRIIVADKVSFRQGITPEEGEPIRAEILHTINEGESIVLDFSDIGLITTAFLNVVIGTLYKDFSSERLKSLLFFENVSPEIARRIKRVTNNAKLFYANPKQFQENVDSVIYGKG
ncbi:MAG: STAS-like domain-containing protein [Muribaculaceae bacterium]|nr:STAS-like domain-containing protein [Muribaculaceae bacterium]